MVYKINNTELLLQPTVGRWVRRPELGIDGAAHPIYPAVREFYLSWIGMSPADYNQLQNFFETVITTGTASVDLPEYGGSTYTFKTYSGCTLSEPEFSSYFAEHQLDASMLIHNIQT